MRYIQKFFQSKKSVEEFIEENGMEKAVAEFGIEKLLMYKLIYQYEGTQLYYDDNFSVITKVYNKEGKCLGYITQLMSPYYKKLGHFFGPCLNGNIIVYQNREGRTGKTYGIFDKNGNNIIPLGKYSNFCYLPNGVAIMSGCKDEKEDMVTIHYDGTVKRQPFTYIEKDETTGEYEVHLRDGETAKVCYTSEKVVNDMMDSSTEIGTIEKGIE